MEEEQASGQISETEDNVGEEAEGEKNDDNAPSDTDELSRPLTSASLPQNQAAKPSRQRAMGKLGKLTWVSRHDARASNAAWSAFIFVSFLSFRGLGRPWACFTHERAGGRGSRGGQGLPGNSNGENINEDNAGKNF